MSLTVCLTANTLYYPEGGGHLWVYLNWALGLRALGCRVIWLEGVVPSTPVEEVKACVKALKDRLARYDLAESVALCAWNGERLAPGAVDGCLDFEATMEADLLLNLGYHIPDETVSCFRRSALVDIDPGLLQVWMSQEEMSLARHDVYFTIGETVGRPGARFSRMGIPWNYTPPCVALDWWPVHRAADDAPFTTVSHWYQEGQWIEYDGKSYKNDKREGFLPFLDLPRHTGQRLELALCLTESEEDERELLWARGWRVRDSYEVAATPWEYQRYIQTSRGEFSCVKPSCVHLQNAWISDRTLCYLASGKPAVVEHTGPSRFLPDAAGLFRFRNLKEAARCLDLAASDYERQCLLARALAEEYFDAPKVVGKVLERALA